MKIFKSLNPLTADDLAASDRLGAIVIRCRSNSPPATETEQALADQPIKQRFWAPGELVGGNRS